MYNEIRNDKIENERMTGFLGRTLVELKYQRKTTNTVWSSYDKIKYNANKKMFGQ